MKKVFLILLSWIYSFILSVRNFFYDFKILKSIEFRIPVISIGNITVGGTGKTPHTEYLIELLKQEFEIASLSRGYKRKTKGFRYVETTSSVYESGDEPLQIKLKFPQVTVAVDENRVNGINKLLSSDGIHTEPDAIILDDAFQHRSVKPGINILLIDFNRPITQDHILPYGRLRESASERSRANFIIITKCPKKIQPITERILYKELEIKPYQNLFFTTFDYGELTPVFDDTNNKVIATWEEQKHTILLVTGIASPVLLTNYLKPKARKVIDITYPDHHFYTSKDIQNIQDNFEAIESDTKIIVTTEKDMVRLKELDLPDTIRKNLYYIPLVVNFLNNKKQEFDRKIMNYVRENKTNLRLQSKTTKHSSEI